MPEQRYREGWMVSRRWRPEPERGLGRLAARSLPEGAQKVAMTAFLEFPRSKEPVRRSVFRLTGEFEDF
jgi:hypothetical protein